MKAWASRGIDNFILTQLNMLIPLKSSRVGELQYAISAEYDERLKNSRFQNGKIERKTEIAGRAYIVMADWRDM